MTCTMTANKVPLVGILGWVLTVVARVALLPFYSDDSVGYLFL